MRLAGPLLRSLAVNDRVFAEPAKQSSTKAETRLAILCGEGEQAPAEAALAQLEVTLSREQRLAPVGRAEIKRILEEQKLSASGLIVRKILQEQKLSMSGIVKPETAIHLGGLLGAALFLFVEKVPGAKSALLEFKVVEAKTGITLA